MKRNGFLYDDKKRGFNGIIRCEVYGQMTDGSKVWKEVGKDDSVLYELSTRGGLSVFYIQSVN